MDLVYVSHSLPLTLVTTRVTLAWMYVRSASAANRDRVSVCSPIEHKK
jgi:hypothetical protein